MKGLIPAEIIERKIYLVRGRKVMLDRDLALLYEVETRALNQAARRNPDSFPEDFMLDLARDEILRISQFVTSSGDHRAPLKFSKRVLAFTEQGVAMLSSVLRSKRATLVNVEIMRTFVRLRQVIATHKEFAEKLADLEQRIGKNELDIRTVAQVIRDLMQPKEDKPKRKIGFSIP
ncbi:MAG: hypothetical protein A3G41_01815 [Elusimicrobia bacterium RIFCSPLOWO2_12_FULL_59_9]|nr:MAG: hypothetical protein A3G41_01815 [Elusimicrobia bacterium RIFCSPLOWO2_12_FULL_59_9]